MLDFTEVLKWVESIDEPLEIEMTEMKSPDAHPICSGQAAGARISEFLKTLRGAEDLEEDEEEPEPMKKGQSEKTRKRNKRK